MTGGAAGPVLLAPSLAGVDPRFLPELERVQALIADGNYSAARRVLDALLQREPVGPALSAARAFERMLDLDPSFLPSLQALARAVESGSDREATAILKRMYLRQPRGRVLELLEAYRRILDGRAVVANLRLRLECRPEKEIPKGAPEGAKVARLFLVAESGLHETVELDTGPATLFVTRSVVGSGGIERDAVETKTYDGFSRLVIEPGKSAEVSLAAFFVSTARARSLRGCGSSSTCARDRRGSFRRVRRARRPRRSPRSRRRTRSPSRLPAPARCP
jgi:hypothetical protein